MTIATTTDLAGALPAILERVQDAPVYIREGDRDLAVLVSLEDFETIRLHKVAQFQKLRAETAAEFEANLAKDGITPEEFLRDLFEND